VIQRNVFAYTVYVYVIDVLLNVSYIIKCQWLEYLFIDILNTDEELCTPCLRFPCSQMLLKLACYKTDIRVI
jgi:hypothetical protein